MGLGFGCMSNAVSSNEEDCLTEPAEQDGVAHFFMAAVDAEDVSGVNIKCDITTCTTNSMETMASSAAPMQPPLPLPGGTSVSCGC